MEKHLNCSLEQNKRLLECKVRPKPIIPYFGGKARVADKIINHLPDHDTFVEPFAGGASVYWADTRAEKFVVNDSNKDIYKLYKTAKTNPSQIKNCKINVGKKEFDAIKNKNNKNGCDIVKLHRNGFGGLPKSWVKQSRVHKNKFSEEHIKKLKNTVILNQDFKKVAKKYDKNGVVQYWDPPYVKGGENYNTHGVTPKEVCDAAKSLKHAKVAISYDTKKEIKKSCKGLKFKKIKVPYSAKVGKTFKKEEYLITNF